MKYLISGGGTGGHIFPAVSIANALREADPSCEILFVGALGRMEMERVPQAGYPIIGLPVKGFDRSRPWKNVRVVIDLIRSMMQARKIVRDFRPDVGIGVGGYASGAAMKVAAKMGVPILLQEQNGFAGVTNKLLKDDAKKICVAYEGMDVAADNTTIAAKLKFTYGDDVTGIKYLIVNGNVEKNPAEALAILASGTDENILSVEHFKRGGKEANIKAGLEGGLYTVVAAPADKAGALRIKEATAKSFYFPGLGAAEDHPCEFNAALVLPSTYNPALVANYPDETSLVYMALGTEIASVKTYINKSSVIATWEGTPEELVAAYGTDVSAAVLEKINSENGYAGVYNNLTPGTEYTMIFVDTHTDGNRFFGIYDNAKEIHGG